VAVAGGTDPGAAPLVVHVIYRLDYGGLENGLVNLINTLAPARYRHAVACLAGYTDYRERLRPGVEVFDVAKRPGHDAGMLARLWRHFRRLRPAIVHSRNLAALEAQLPAWLAGVPGRVHGEHGRDVHDLDNARRRYRWLRRAYAPLVQRYVPLSAELEAYLRREVGIPARKIARICNGVDTARFTPAAATRDRAWLAGAPFDPAGRVVIGTVGRMEPVKDPLLLVRAFAALVAALPGARERLALVMIGTGSLYAAARAALDAAGLADLAWLPGARSDVAEPLRSFDLFVQPSLAEGISNTILEAMASGLPVVATAVGGNEELVVPGATGALVPRADVEAMAAAMRRYVDDVPLRRAHGGAARRRAESEFSLASMADRYAAVYDHLLGSARPAPARDAAA